MNELVFAAGETLAFSLLGAMVFGVVFWVVVKMAPFSVRKEIEEDQNTSLAILLGSVFIGLAMIISAVLQS